MFSDKGFSTPPHSPLATLLSPSSFSALPARACSQAKINHAEEYMNE